MQKAIIIVSILLGYLLTISAQGVKIGNDGSAADPSAMLEIESTDKGVLVARMTESQRDAIASPATGLLIFQTDVTQGFYYWTGGCWQMIGDITPCVSGPTYPTGSVFCASGPTAIVDVLNPTTGNTWMDRNLGASQVASNSTDAASYGDLYQWGRAGDGHQCRNSGTNVALSSSDQPGHGDFITTSINPYDWRSGQNANLWQGVNGINNPCPSGYRLPTDTELDAERASWTPNYAAGAFASPLKLPMAGLRDAINGSLTNVGTYGSYWSSTVGITGSRRLYFFSTVASFNTIRRTYGLAVRCLKD